MVSTILISSLVAFIITRPTTAATTTKSISKHQIIHTHKFHTQPHDIVRTISNVQQTTAINVGDESSLIDIDVSSTQLDDNATVSLVEEILQRLQNDDDSAEEKKVPLRIKLALAMNKITPFGASKLIDTLINRNKNNMEEEDVGETTVNGTITSGVKDVKDVSEETDVDVNAATQVSEDDATTQVEEPSILIEQLDLSFNDIGGHGLHPPSIELSDSIRRLFESNDRSSLVPRVLVLENCGVGPIFCRSIGRGILTAYESKTRTTNGSMRPSVLRLGGNSDIGDAGCVALAASLRMAIDENSNEPVLEELDLSSCDIGDAGAEALALAISSNHGCLLRLDMSNNRITDAGCKALGRAIVDARLCSGITFEEIILDNNFIGDEGASVLAEALGCGASKSISMRSCSIQAQGMAAFGSAIANLANRKDCDSTHFHIDLSGNKFGLKKIKKKKSSAGRIKDKASSNIKFVGKTLMGAAKRFSSESMGISADSDDDEEVMGGLIDDIDEENDIDNGHKLKSCGAQAFTAEILRADQPSVAEKGNKQISIGMRQCCLDDAAIDALSASIVGSKSIQLSVDVSMNGFDEDIVDALAHENNEEDLLSSMAEEHMEYMDRLAERAEEANIGFGFSNDDFDGYDDYNQYDDYDPYDDF